MSSIEELMTVERGVRARRRYLASLVVLVVAAVVAGLLLWRDLRDDRPHARAGSFVGTEDVLPMQWRRSVLVPGVRYDVTAAVREDVTDDPEVHARQAPDDGTFVALGIAVGAQPGPTVPDLEARDRDAPTEPRFTLVADGRRYELPDVSDTYQPPPRGIAVATDTPVNGWLAVAGSAGRLVLETSWQGRVQRLDLRSGTRTPGDFAALYAQRSVGATPAVTTSCGTAVWTPGWRAGPGVPLACSYRVERLAWTKSLGWAKAGRQWLALTTRTSVPSNLIRRVGGRDLGYSYTGNSDSSADAREVADSPDRLDGARPVALADVRVAGEDATVALVFDVAGASAPHTAVVTQDVQVRLRDGSGSSDTYYDNGVRQSWTIRIT